MSRIHPFECFGKCIKSKIDSFLFSVFLLSARWLWKQCLLDEDRSNIEGIFNFGLNRSKEVAMFVDMTQARSKILKHSLPNGFQFFQLILLCWPDRWHFSVESPLLQYFLELYPYKFHYGFHHKPLEGSSRRSGFHPLPLSGYQD